jgi:CheY-like chemotaxis protein
LASGSHCPLGMKTSPRQNEKILLVDDNAVVRDMLVDLVESLGYSADPAASGEEALAMFERAQYDVVLTDLLMPGMTGWDVLEAVHQRDPQVPVIIITGSPVVGDGHAAQPGVAILKKPVDVALLDSMIKRMLGQRPGRAASLPS